MVRHWTDSELREELRKMTVVADTREQRNAHILSWLDRNSIPHIRRKLNVGDYSAMIDNITFERSVAIERKHSLDELCINFTGDRERFEREFIRAKSVGTKIYLIIEDCSWHDIYTENYRSRLRAETLLSSLFAWLARFNVTVILCESEYTPRIIYRLLYEAVREELLNG